MSYQKRICLLASALIAASEGVHAIQAIALAVRIIDLIDRWESAIGKELEP